LEEDEEFELIQRRVTIERLHDDAGCWLEDNDPRLHEDNDPRLHRLQLQVNHVVN
jgi:hypothetical protein